MGVCPGKSNWKCNRMLFCGIHSVLHIGTRKGSNRKKDNIAVFFHRIRPVFDRKSVVG